MSLDDERRFICKQQQELFEYVQEHHGDVRAFAEAFLKSDFCNRSLDRPYSVDQYADILNWLEFLEWENITVRPALRQQRPVSFRVAGWLGFTYRQLQIETGLQSRELWEKVPIDKLIRAWPGLHTVDEEMAAEIIISDFHLTEHGKTPKGYDARRMPHPCRAER